MVNNLEVERSLKNNLGLFINELNKCNKLATKVRNTKNDVWGKEVRKAVKINDKKFLTFVTTLKNISIEIDLNKHLSKLTFQSIINAYIQDRVSDMVQKGIDDFNQLWIQGQGDFTLSGLEILFNDSPTLYGLYRSDESSLCPTQQDHPYSFDESVLFATLQKANSIKGNEINFILVSKDIKMEYENYLCNKNLSINIIELGDGSKCLSYQGIPVVCDSNIKEGTVYLLNTEYIRLHQLCDWRWLEQDNGRIIKDGKAHLVKYCDLVCERPDYQTKLTFKTKLHKEKDGSKDTQKIIDSILKVAALNPSISSKLIEQVEFYKAGRDGRIPDEWKDYEEQISTEYKKYLELKQIFEK